MIELGGGKTWFTSLELEQLALPGLPKSKRKINERAADEDWALRVDGNGMPWARKRGTGRGGGMEWHLSLLPDVAKAELVRRGIAWMPANDEDAVSIARQTQGWAWYEMQTDKVKAEAERRAAILDMFEGFIAAGMNRTAAARATHQSAGDSVGTIYNYLKLVKGIRRADYLPALAPRRKGGGKECEVDDGAWQYLKSEYLRPERPTFSSCCFNTVKYYAAPRGIEMPNEKTLLRKLQREVDPRVIVAMRKGMDAVRNMVPPQQRSKAHMFAMDMVNIDGHKFDVFVNFGKDAAGKDIIARPMMVAIQDVYSSMMLAWRIGETESALLTRLAFADLFRDYGIPNRCLMDNGRAFASKWVTGGVRNRFRFTIREDDPLGLLPSLGIGVQFAQPYSGQSKPIERSFRTLADFIAKDIRCAGAYTGNHIDNKPENYGARAVPLDVFVQVVRDGMAAYNEREGRRTETTNGSSYQQTFQASYETAPIGRASPEHLRLALLTGEKIKADRKDGSVRIVGNRYWSRDLSRHAGQLLTIRFDPDDLTLPIHVYSMAGDYICTADRVGASQFDSVEDAKQQKKTLGDMRKTVRRLKDQENLLSAQQLEAQRRYVEKPAPELVASVVRPARFRGNTALKAAPKSLQTPVANEQVDQFVAAVSKLRVVE
ncbi:transposase domain-containing protein [Sphingobium yanoikuyae]|uniref:Mu transposase C-terminal domain-containing protein n=1 Tax=Sphingobium yanoikuyae TaxID=13690 RepID=A0A9X7YE94_SPHYA|nr:transposase domain-containing protein [Sphingobium yanoikuyae]QNG47397.1 Mu transposase C-terminal domain-containing protein [Sphingobium yanoikuyae]